MSGGRPAVFLDRDGVLLRAFVDGGVPRPPATMAEFEVLPGVAAACRTLRAAGLALVVVTNQPDVARGSTTRAVVDAINGAMAAALELDDVVVCPHDDQDGCGCRKPAPGMLIDAAHRLGLDLSRSVMIGDRWRDIAAGRAARCRTIFVDRSYPEKKPEQPDATVKDLPDAVPIVLAWLDSRQEAATCPT